MGEGKERLDVLLIKKGLARSRENAKELIASGSVFVDGCPAGNKPGAVFSASAKLEVTGEPMKYVSRGGKKLEKAIKEHGISLRGKVCLDAGASTGGFTDCMLQNGAAKVFAVDVGEGQLAEKLQLDPRVISMEKTNIRYLTGAEVGEAVDFVSVDVAFISLTMVFGSLRGLMKPGAEFVALIKPQFEAGRAKVGKKGVVREPKVQEEIIEHLILFSAGLGFELLHLDYSPVKGPEGNIEYLLHGRNAALSSEDIQVREDVERMQRQVARVVAEAHQALPKGR